VSIGANIKILREKRGFSQVKFAEAVGISQAMICQIERGGKIPSLALSKVIADVLHCTTDDLVNEKGAEQ